MFTLSLSIVAFKILSLNGQWRRVADMAYKDYGMAVGYYDDTIWLIGGDENSYALNAYSVNDNTHSTIDPNVTWPVSVDDYSQGYIQIGHMVYMTDGKYYEEDPDYHYLGSFNLLTREYNRFWQYLELPANGECIYGCFTGNEETMYYIGGRRGYDYQTHFKTTMILNVSNRSWSSGPQMNERRGYFSCIISSNMKLYAIGGYQGDSTNTDTIEYIPTDNIHQNTWEYTLTTMDETLYGTRAVSYFDTIFVIGGAIIPNGEIAQKRVHIIDTTTDIVTLSDDYLEIAVFSPGIILLDHTIYALGGAYQWGYSSSIRTAIQAYPIPTQYKNPTVSPTPYPSPSPTDSNNAVYIEKSGSDTSCCHLEHSPCKTIHYAYDVFLGNNGCDAVGLDGNGAINIGDGEWLMPFVVDLLIDNETQTIINGNGMNNTQLYINEPLGCESWNCWLEIRNLAIRANSTSDDHGNTQQIIATNGGTLIFESVLFEQMVNIDWEIADEGTLSLISCIFTNNTIIYNMNNEVHAMISNTVFESNRMEFHVGDSLLVIHNSTFIHNRAYTQSIIKSHQSSLYLSDSIFMHNTADAIIDIIDNEDFTSFGCPSFNASAIVTVNNYFINNSASSLMAMFQSTANVQKNILINNTCQDFCIKSIGSAVSLDMKNDYHYFYFEGNANDDSKSTLCINETDTLDVSQYLSFGDINDTNANNVKVLFSECKEKFTFKSANRSIPYASMVVDYLQSEPGGAVLGSYQCLNNVSSCAVLCNNSVSCFGSTFNIKSDVSTIHCDSVFACGYSTIDTSQSTSQLDTAHIICDQQSSCVAAIINITNVNRFNLDCYDSNSCSQVILNINNVHNATISCYALSSSFTETVNC